MLLAVTSTMSPGKVTSWGRSTTTGGSSNGRSNVSATVSEVREGDVPGRSSVAYRGEKIDALTWFCPAAKAAAAAAVRGYISRDGKPLFKLDKTTIELVSHGEAALLIPTPDETPEPRNRRVEITVR